ncbi:hypothetical protein NM688_g8156 [Phlebia brevispora]|uniref:Uncharacterized protein n=1 Tax=Phlebia brevispora TaxID=194682 RepID=A0ACC1RWJ9_9APHY|nr:hypothetical protein NM688_g8156 [Phlebia brevispora]
MVPQLHTATGTSPHDPDMWSPLEAPRVPMDVQFSILDCILNDPALRKLALTCMLVCRTWAARCAPIAYSRLQISTSRSLDDIETHISSDKGNYVRDVVIRYRLELDGTPPEITWGDRVLHLLQRLVPRVTSLRYLSSHFVMEKPVYFFNPHASASQMLHSRLATFSELTHLSLRAYNFGDARNLLAVLHTLPQLLHFEGTSLTWRRANTANPLPSTDLRLRSLVLRACTAVAPLLFIWTMPNVTATSESRFSSIDVRQMNGLIHIIRLCKGMTWNNSARISLVENVHVETPWTLRIEGITGILVLEVHIGFTDGATRAACSVRSIVLHRWPSDQTVSLIKRLKKTAVQYLPPLMCLEKITIMEYATSVLERGFMGRTTSSWTPSPSVIFRRQGADHAGVFLSTILDPMAAGKGLLDNENEPVIFRQGSRIKHEINVSILQD